MSNAQTQSQRPSGLSLDWRSARLEQAVRRFTALLARVPVRVWRFLVILILVVWLSHSLARLFWLIIPAPELPPAQVSANALVTDRPTASSQVVDIDSLKDLQIFGRVDEAVAAEAEQEAAQQIATGIEDEAVDTQLRLVLRGVVSSANDEQARAIIADGNKQALYKPGDELPAGRGVTLAKVMGRRVILNNNGRYESLWLFTDSPQARRDIQRQVAPEPAVSRSWEGDDEQVYDSPSPDETVQEEHVAEPESEVISVPPEQLASATGQSLADVVSMSIHREGGNIVGYRIRPGRNAELFHSLGLMSDDIVTAVNGTPLDSPGKVMEIYQNMGNANSASLEIRRGGETLSIEIVLD